MKFVGSGLLCLTAFACQPAFAVNESYAEADAKAEARMSSLDWSKPVVIELTLHDHLFEPDEVVLPINQPVVLRLRNAGKVNHDMVGGSFFQAIVIKHVTTGAGRVMTPFVKGVVVRAKQDTEIWLMPVKAGTFSFYCSISGHREQGMEGKITIR